MLCLTGLYLQLDWPWVKTALYPGSCSLGLFWHCTAFSDENECYFDPQFLIWGTGSESKVVLDCWKLFFGWVCLLPSICKPHVSPSLPLSDNLSCIRKQGWSFPAFQQSAAVGSLAPFYSSRHHHCSHHPHLTVSRCEYMYFRPRLANFWVIARGSTRRWCMPMWTNWTSVKKSLSQPWGHSWKASACLGKRRRLTG